MKEGEETKIVQIQSVVKVTRNWTFFRPYFSDAGIIGEQEKFL